MTDLRGALLVGGTSSDAGKSLVVAGLCRALVREGVRVAPFKAQNMSNNSVVTLDGGEIGRAQALQATACGLPPSTRFNPVLLKPGSDRRSHVVVRGRPAGDVGARDYLTRRAELREVVADELASLRAEFDVVICEGAGSVAEINLRASDIANMGLARSADLPVILVSDIDRGGSLAHLFGTTAILEPADQALVAGYVINKFRGDQTILDPGLHTLGALTGRPTLGVLPYVDDLWIDAEDSLAAPVGRRVGPPEAAGAFRTGQGASERLSVAAIRLPRISNSTDVEALACEPGVDVTWVADPASVRAADLVVVPGTRATVADLAWLRERGLDVALTERAARHGAILGICGGFQMLGRRIVDSVESSGGAVVDGLGLLDVDVRFEPEKVLRTTTGVVDGVEVAGYEIHHGRVVDSSEASWIDDDEQGPEGARRDAIWGTHWHGLLASNEFRRRYLREVAAVAGKHFEPAGDTDVAAIRGRQLDLMADLVTAHLDMAAICDIIGSGAPRRAPTIAHYLGENR
ncbi:cobyric acid synthase CobQ [Gordonia sp. 852002-50816_SCH5313054-c]|uniref:cobyric acid synthase n=1 Tax=unclassified Gordonia (in: high G+C Gram-positive bacteria) TaxID=2657482 RepID=UPI0007E99765|nr:MULTISPECIES: cobyric acid synthase [unclassified Gordonia (in: high G+C Gram-positive bacteria)]OBC12850.1 cobyric acid synthase CobQ [Gordonia sp. 852002-50816_SCH5313054-a]OBC18845.1 cobyric acid synthase CobQ [Gordonia sp. 852002-50816_SCH5313054-c]